MSQRGPIVFIDDDKDGWMLFNTAFHDLKIDNRILFFKNGKEAFRFLEQTEEAPFLILCDIHMPIMDGFALHKRISDNERLKRKAIPFVFHSDSASPEEVQKAYDLSVQGFFVKKAEFEEIKNQLKLIIDYWRHCTAAVHP